MMLTMEERDNLIKRAVELIINAKYLTALTGAGISAESGIPTFRGKNGLWKRFRAEELATLEAFLKNPKLVWKWYKWRMEIIHKAKPNDAHLCLAKLEKFGLLKMLITQNVDGLHIKASSSNVIELHGNIWRARCTHCGFRIVFNSPPKNVPVTCPKCGKLMRPDVVWFGEPIPRDALDKAFEYAFKSDVMLVIGTSLLVQPAASLPFIVLRNNGKVIEINTSNTILTRKATVFINQKAAEAMKMICEEVNKIMS